MKTIELPPARPAKSKSTTPGSALSRAMRKQEQPGKLRTIGEVQAALTAAGPDEFKRENPKLIARSPFNREYFDPSKLAELTENVRQNGVLEPLIVRPIPSGEWYVNPVTMDGGKRHSWQVTPRAWERHVATLQAGAPECYWSRFKPAEFPTEKEAEANLPKWELVAGERRWRAAVAADLPLVPILVRDLDDRGAIELQIIENLQREDLRPMDEARAFKQLKDFGFTMPQLSEKLNLAESTIYGRLKLLEISDEARVSVEEGTIPASHAELLTKIDDPAAQLKLAKAFLTPKDVYTGGKLVERGIVGFREAKALTDEAVKQEEKEKAWQKETEKYVAEGYKVLSLSQGEGVFVYGGLRAGYVGVTDKCDLDPKQRTWKALLGDHAPQAIVAHNSYSYGSGAKTRIVFARKAAEKALKLAGHDFAANPGEAKKLNGEAMRKLQEERRERAEQKRFVVNAANVAKVIAAVETREPNADFYRLVIDGMKNNIGLQSLVKRRQIAVEKPDDHRAADKAFDGFVAKADGKTLRGVLLELLLWDWGTEVNQDTMKEAAKLFKVKLQTSGKDDEEGED